MTHDEYVKRRDDILNNLAIDMTNTTIQERISLAEDAKQAIDQLFLDMVGEEFAIPTGPRQMGKTSAHVGNQIKDQLRTIVKGDPQ